MCALSFFFFQAEDGIRDYKVTGVQTCALPICAHDHGQRPPGRRPPERAAPLMLEWGRELCGDLDAAERREWLCTNGIGDRKSTRLNSSHLVISYAVFCLKKKKKITTKKSTHWL